MSEATLLELMCARQPLAEAVLKAARRLNSCANEFPDDRSIWGEYLTVLFDATEALERQERLIADKAEGLRPDWVQAGVAPWDAPPAPQICGKVDLSSVDIRPGIVTFCRDMPTDFYAMTGAGMFKNGVPMTATEVRARQTAADEARDLGKDETWEKAKGEALRPLIDRTLGIMERRGLLPPAVNGGPQPEPIGPVVRPTTRPATPAQIEAALAYWRKQGREARRDGDLREDNPVCDAGSAWHGAWAEGWDATDTDTEAARLQAMWDATVDASR